MEAVLNPMDVELTKLSCCKLQLDRLKRSEPGLMKILNSPSISWISRNVIKVTFAAENISFDDCYD